MSGSQVLTQRNRKKIIEQKFIENVLKAEAKNIKEAQDMAFDKSKTSNVIRGARVFSVSNNTLTHRHDIRQRFDDMKKVRFRKQKPTKAHNKIIWGHFNRIIFKMAYGFTEEVKKQLAEQYNIEI